MAVVLSANQGQCGHTPYIGLRPGSALTSVAAVKDTPVGQSEEAETMAYVDWLLRGRKLVPAVAIMAAPANFLAAQPTRPAKVWRRWKSTRDILVPCGWTVCVLRAVLVGPARCMRAMASFSRLWTSDRPTSSWKRRGKSYPAKNKNRPLFSIFMARRSKKSMSRSLPRLSLNGTKRSALRAPLLRVFLKRDLSRSATRSPVSHILNSFGFPKASNFARPRW